jgi:hypothetical protein
LQAITFKKAHISTSLGEATVVARCSVENLAHGARQNNDDLDCRSIPRALLPLSVGVSEKAVEGHHSKQLGGMKILHNNHVADEHASGKLDHVRNSVAHDGTALVHGCTVLEEWNNNM